MKFCVIFQRIFDKKIIKLFNIQDTIGWSKKSNQDTTVFPLICVVMTGLASPSASGVGQKLFPNPEPTYSAVKFFFIKKYLRLFPKIQNAHIRQLSSLLIKKNIYEFPGIRYFSEMIMPAW